MKQKDIKKSRVLKEAAMTAKVMSSAAEIATKFSAIFEEMSLRHSEFTKHLPKLSFEVPKTSPLSISLWLESPLHKVLDSTVKVREKLEDNPELQFTLITSLEVLNLKSYEELKKSLIEDVDPKHLSKNEEILERNLGIYLSRYSLSKLWKGANLSLGSDNPDRFRHCLVSLRTLLEHTIDKLLAPNEKIKDAEIFRKQFEPHFEGKKRLEDVKVKRDKKIEYSIAQFDFNFLDKDFITNEVKFICDCYSILCDLHNPQISLTENQIRSLKLKTGITLWILLHIHEFIEKKVSLE